MNRLLTMTLAFGVACATGCQLPTRQLEDYRSAFSQARAAGEEVLLDYGAARETYEERLAERGLSDEDTPDARTRLAFDPDDVAEAPADAVVVRMKAWAVLADYNAALVALAEGRSSEEIAGAAEGLLSSVGALSAEAAADLAPFGGVITSALEQLQRGIERREFERAVRGAEPLIADLAGYLVQDARSFYNVRLGLRNLAYSAETDAAADRRDAIEDLLARHEHEGEDRSASEIADRVNASLSALPDWREEDLLMMPPLGEAPYTAALHAQLSSLAGEIGERVKSAREIDARLLAYRETLSGYVRLVRRLRASHTALLRAVEDSELALPPPEEIIEHVVAVRQAFRKYESRR